MKPILSIKYLKKSFGDTIILNNLSVDIYPKESFVVAGISGCGKSVFIKTISGLIKPDEGEIIFEGQDVSEKGMFSDIGMLFQGGALFDSMSVIENIAFGLIYGKKMKKKEAHEIAIEKLRSVDLNEDVMHKFPSEISGGMKKRVALARSIATNPKIILFDEPTTGLDPITSGIVNNLMIQCVKEIGATSIIITHDLDSIKKVGDRMGLLFGGKFEWIGNVGDMYSEKNPYIHQFVNGLPEGPLTS